MCIRIYNFPQGGLPGRAGSTGGTQCPTGASALRQHVEFLHSGVLRVSRTQTPSDRPLPVRVLSNCGELAVPVARAHGCPGPGHSGATGTAASPLPAVRAVDNVWPGGAYAFSCSFFVFFLFWQNHWPCCIFLCRVFQVPGFEVRGAGEVVLSRPVGQPTVGQSTAKLPAEFPN